MAAKCMYEVLGVERTASQAEVKKAYYKLALQLHPDKCGKHDEESTAKFQLLQKVYGVLGDPEKRKVYDETGATDDDELSSGKFDDLVDYFRSLYKVTEDDIDDFQAGYQGSDEERADLLRFYSQFRGNMGEVFRWLMCSDEAADSHRLMDVLEEAIAKGEVQRYKPFTAWAKAVAAKPRPAPRKKPAGGKKQGAGAGSSNALVAAIQAKRAAAADDFFDALAAKYGGGASKGAGGGKAKGKGQGGKGQEEQALAEAPGRKGKGKAAVDDVPEEAFAAARARLEARGVFQKQDAAAAGAGAGAAAGKKRARRVVQEEEEETGSESCGGEDDDEEEAGSVDEEEDSEEEEAGPSGKAGSGGGRKAAGAKAAGGKGADKGGKGRDKAAAGGSSKRAQQRNKGDEKENEALQEGKTTKQQQHKRGAARA